MVLKAYTVRLVAALFTVALLGCAKTKTETEIPLHENTKQWQQDFRFFLQNTNDTLHLESFRQNQYPVYRYQNSEIRGERIVREYEADKRNFKITLDLSSKWPEDLSQKEDELLLTFRYQNHEQVVQFALVAGRIDTSRHPSQNLLIRGQNVNEVFVEPSNNHSLLIANGVGIIGFVIPQNDTILGFNP